MCYRTQVALRILVLPIRKWERFVDGLEDMEDEQGAMDRILGKVLKNLKIEVQGKMDSVEGLKEDVGMKCQRDMLRRRWMQIEGLIQAALVRIQS